MLQYLWNITFLSFRKAHIHPFCNRIKQRGLQTECTEERDAVALCNLVEYTDKLPQEYQHFHRLLGVHKKDVAKYAGSVVLADYCPYIQVNKKLISNSCYQSAFLIFKTRKDNINFHQLYHKSILFNVILLIKTILQEFNWKKGDIVVRGSRCGLHENNAGEMSVTYWAKLNFFPGSL